MGTLSRAVGTLAAALLAVGLTGCGDGPTAREVQDEHEAESRTTQDEIESALEPLSTTGELLGTAVRDSCVTGQHNWKIDDPYDVLCTVQVVHAYRITGPDFRTAADGVTQAYPQCPEGVSYAEETLRDYWDKLKGTQTHNFEQPYRPDYLPDYDLGCEDRPAVQITVTGWATLPADEETLRRREHGMGRPCVINTQTDPCRWDGIPARNIFQFDAANEGWIAFVSGSAEYARTS